MLLYWLVLKPISLLPYPLLYGLSDFFFVVLYYLVRYRRKVVQKNLRLAFPQMKEFERQEIERKFYRHLCDLVVESLKNFSITEKQARARMKMLHTEAMDQFARQGKGVILAGGHMENWELWAVAAPCMLEHKLIGIYKRLSHPFFDRKMRESRSKFGLELVSTRDTAEYMRQHPDEVNALVFAIDQSPANPEKAEWFDFLGINTPHYFGVEKYARDLDRPVIWGHIRKVRRGHYEVWYEVVIEKPSEMPQGGIVREVSRILENDIYACPEHWLWSHKRWKHTPEWKQMS